MPTFVLLTQLSPEALRTPRSLQAQERHVAEQIELHCPGVRWLTSLALLGPWDYLDIFEAPDLATATRVSVLARREGRSRSEIWPAMDWQDFKWILKHLPAHARQPRSADAARPGKAAATGAKRKRTTGASAREAPAEAGDDQPPAAFDGPPLEGTEAERAVEQVLEAGAVPPTETAGEWFDVEAGQDAPPDDRGAGPDEPYT